MRVGIKHIATVDVSRTVIMSFDQDLARHEGDLAVRTTAIGSVVQP